MTNSNGTLTSQQRYLPFGEVRQLPNYPTTQLTTDFGYTGQRNLDGTGLMDYRARFYSQSLGRFIQPDNVIPNPGNPQEFNRYSYVNNAPINYNDPTGHWKCHGSNYQCQIRARKMDADIDYEKELHDRFDWTFDGTWSKSELKVVYEVALRVEFLVGGADIMLQMFGSVLFDKKAMSEGGVGDAHHVTLNENFSKWSLGDQKWTIAHELGHAWDGANGWGLSTGLQNSVHSTYPALLHGRNGDVIYYGSSGNGPGATGWPEHDWTWDEASRWNKKEDFAQSFAAYIYPGTATKKLWENYHQTYGSGYNSYYDTPRGQYIAEQIRGYWPFY